jgi:hypothetical protein
MEDDFGDDFDDFTEGDDFGDFDEPSNISEVPPSPISNILAGLVS